MVHGAGDDALLPIMANGGIIAKPDPLLPPSGTLHWCGRCQGIVAGQSSLLHPVSALIFEDPGIGKPWPSCAQCAYGLSSGHLVARISLTKRADTPDEVAEGAWESPLGWADPEDLPNRHPVPALP
jgi:hypothetical protein